MNKKALVVLAEGFEELEAVAPIDILRRAGVEVIVAGVASKIVKSSRGVGIETDRLLTEIKDLPDAIILPGGLPGATNLAQSPQVTEWIKKMNAAGKIIAAICASPVVVLAPTGVLNHKVATCYPGTERNFSKVIQHSEARVVVSKNIITSQGPGTAAEFGLELAKALVGEKVAHEVAKAMLIRDSQ